MTQTRQRKMVGVSTSYLERIKELEAEVAFLGDWSFVPGEGEEEEEVAIGDWSTWEEEAVIGVSSSGEEEEEIRVCFPGKWKGKRRLQSGIGGLFSGEKKRFSNTRDHDVILSCTSDGSRLLAHRLILANRSNVFRLKLQELDVTGKSKEVNMEGFGGRIVKVFLKFLYTAKVSDKDMHANYKELLKLADLYQVKLLRVKLDKFICAELLKKDSLVEYLKMAYLYDLEATRETAQDLIVDDDDDELFDRVYNELLKDDSGMAFDLSKSIFNRLKKKTKVK